MLLVTKLEPLSGQQKSFYNKATVIKEGSTVLLKSYDTIVARIDWYNKPDDALIVYGRFSNTTMRHIKAFIVRFGFEYPTVTNKEILEKYMKGGK